MLGKIFGFKAGTKNQQFNYVPRHYDERKEKLNAILEKHDMESMDMDSMKSRIKSSQVFSRQHIGGKYQRQSRMMLFRVLAILVMLVIIAYWLLGMYLPAITEYLE